MRRYFGAAVAASLAMFALPAQAVPVQLFLSTIAPDANLAITGQQANITGCVIAGTNCGQQTDKFGFNNFQQKGSIDTYDMYSTTPTAEVANGVQGTPYTAAQLVAGVGGVSFNIGIDVNTTSAKSETLLLFQVIDLTLNSVLYQFDGVNGSKNIGGDVNGNGFADYQLKNVNLAGGFGVSLTDQILFRASWNGAVDGAESFFLFGGSGGTVINPQCDPNCVSAVPLPAVGTGLPALIAGLFGLVGLHRRRAARRILPV